jgi:peptide/nickel transport system substrate-binding protein
MDSNKKTISKIIIFFAGFFKAIGKSARGVFSSFKKKNNRVDQNGKKQFSLDEKLVFSLSKSRIPNLGQLKYIRKFLTPAELLVIRISIFVMIISILTWGTNFYFNHLQIVPVKGGEYSEALIGAPKYINPLYSGINDVDNDIASLVYSSLFKTNPNGLLEKDLIESYEISGDGKTYSFKIIENAKWHDGRPVVVDDIMFTFNAILNNQYKSNLRQSFLGVAIEKQDDFRFKFVLPEPYAAFLDLLTFGVMPSHIWSEIPAESAQLAELNLKPIGSGPFKPVGLSKDKSGKIKEYALAVNNDYYGVKPLIDLRFKFYSSFDEAIAALNSQDVSGLSYLPQAYKEQILTPNSYNYQKLFLPQLTLIFLNQKRNPGLADKSVRQALALAIDKNTIINETLSGNAYAVYGPILSNSFAYKRDIKKYEYNKEDAIKRLESVDWKLEEISAEQVDAAVADLNSIDEAKKLKAEEIVAMGAGKWRKKDGKFFVIDLKTVDRNENSDIINQIKKSWEEIGIKVSAQALPLSEIQSNIIKQRNFDALFYGEVVGSDPDPYAFWHSSQTGENGFNLSNFSNKEVDRILEDARVISDQAKRQELYGKFQDIIAEEEPAIFMYSPVYTYVQSNKLKGFNVSNILLPKNRFSNISGWYLKNGKRVIF